MYNYYICQHCDNKDSCLNGCSLVRALQNFELALKKVGMK